MKFYKKGVLYAVIDNHEDKPSEKSSVDIVADSIEEAYANGHTTPREVASWLVTSSFRHVLDREVRFNSLLKAGDSVGARIVPKLFNTLKQLANSDMDDVERICLGYSICLAIVLRPFSVSEEDNPYLVDLSVATDMAKDYLSGVGIED